MAVGIEHHETTSRRMRAEMLPTHVRYRSTLRVTRRAVRRPDGDGVGTRLPEPASPIRSVRRPSDVVGRALDVMIAGTLLVLLAPLLGGIAILVKATSKGPVLYRQERVGRNGRSFEILKFRTMLPNADQLLTDLLATDPVLADEFRASHKLCRDPRVSSIGRALRPSGLDELPQLINVLRGEMSIVGPRPITHAEAERYGQFVDLVWSVNPGITGPWQIGGRNDTTYEERVSIDVEYATNRSVRGDLSVLARTASLFVSGQLRGGY
jgi:exopolysaccharide production protein ExoY